MKRKISILSLLSASILILQSCCQIVYKTSTGGEERACPFETQDMLFRLTKSSIHGSDSWQDPIGFQAGASTPITLINKNLSVNAGAIVSLQGAGWKEGSLEGKTNLWYIYIPFALRYQHTSNFYGEIGLQPGLLLSAKDKYEGTSENYMDHMNKFDLSVPIAIGYKFKNNLGVDFRVIPGLNDITKDADEKDRNFVMGLGVSYTFKIK